MSLKNLLEENKGKIIAKWFDAIIETYPSDTANFLKSQENRFANPVGATISQGINNLFDIIMNGSDNEEAYAFLDNIVRIRAIQDFTPSQAVSFMFFLKRIIREELRKAIQEKHIYEELFAFEAKIDVLASSAFDIYMKCREKLYEIKASELRRMTFRLLQRANLLSEVKGQDSDFKEGNDG
ncbi:MAG: RsbRD N-terminal domain-containing protein [Nitrospirae bacterium]|nr:RsbRD N-terminal domain-containing protein [Nitrospirota bacterium]